MYCFSAPDAPSFGDVEGVISIVFHGRPDIPTELSMASEGVVPLGFGFVNDCLSTDGGHWSCVEVKAPKDLVVC